MKEHDNGSDTSKDSNPEVDFIMKKYNTRNKVETLEDDLKHLVERFDPRDRYPHRFGTFDMTEEDWAEIKKAKVAAKKTELEAAKILLAEQEAEFLVAGIEKQLAGISDQLGAHEGLKRLEGALESKKAVLMETAKSDPEAVIKLAEDFLRFPEQLRVLSAAMDTSSKSIDAFTESLTGLSEKGQPPEGNKPDEDGGMTFNGGSSGVKEAELGAAEA